MLAHHLKRLAKPVRYAMDPAHEQAIRNYLAIASRAQGLPSALLSHLTSHHGQSRDIAQDLFSTHDPAALYALLDTFNDRGITGEDYPSFHEFPQAIDRLRQLHQNIAGHGQGQAGAHPAVLRGYTNENVGRRGDSEYGQAPINTPQPIRDMVRGLMIRNGGVPAHPPISDYWLQRLTATHFDPPTRDTLRPIYDQLYQGYPHALVGLHDAMQSLPVGGSQVGRELARGAQAGLQQIYPALWHYGEHGEFPQ